MPVDTESKKNDATSDVESTDSEPEQISMLGFLRSQFNKSSSSAKAKPLPKAPTKTPPKSQPASTAPVVKHSKTKQGNVKASAGKQGAAAVKPSNKAVVGGGKSHAEPEMDDKNKNGEELSAADKTVLESFQSRIEDLGKLDPPVADGPFKQYLTERNQALSAFGGELKQKKKSVSRRTNYLDDPLYIELSKLEEMKNEILTLVKCF